MLRFGVLRLLIPGLVHDFAYRYDCLLRHPRNGGPLEEYKRGAGRRYWTTSFAMLPSA